MTLWITVSLSCAWLIFVFLWVGILQVRTYNLARYAYYAVSYSSEPLTVLGLVGFLLAGLIAVAVRALNSRWHKAITVWMIVMMLALILLLSMKAFELLLTGWILFVAYLIGKHTLMALVRREEVSSLEAAVFSIGTGLGMLALGVFFLGSLGLLYAWPFYSGFAVATVFLGRDVYKRVSLGTFTQSWQRMSGVFRDGSGWSLALVVLWLFFGMASLVGALAPEVWFDALAYHLPFPKAYIQMHHVTFLPGEFKSYWPQNIQMLFTLGLLLGNAVVAKLIHFSFGLLIALGIFALGRRCLGSAPIGLLAAVMFFTTPLVAWEMTTAHMDLGLVLYCFLAIYALLHWVESGHYGWATISGFSLGIALGSKYSAGFYAVPLFVIMLAYAVRYRQQWTLGPLVLLASSLAISSPWYVRTYLATGNPVFPFYNAVFQSPLWPSVNEMMNLNQFGMGRSFLEYISLPWNMMVYSSRFNEGPDGLLGVAFLLFAPLLINLRKLGPATKVLLVHTLMFSILWAFSAHYLRYYLPILPLLGLLCALAVVQFAQYWQAKTAFLRRLVMVTVVGTLAVNIFWSLQISGFVIPTRIPYRVVLGLETEEEYLSRVIPAYATFQYMNRHYNGGARILSLGEFYQFYSESPLVHMGLEGYDIESEERARTLLAGKGITHVLLNTAMQSDRYQPSLRVWNEFLSQNLLLEYAHSGVFLYRMRPALSSNRLEGWGLP